MTPAEKLRARVVTLVLVGILVLAGGLYALIGALLWSQGQDAVPDGLWLAAGAFGGALTSLLVNSKGEGPTEVTTAPGDVVATVAAEEVL